MDNQSAPTNPTDVTASSPVATPSVPTLNPASSIPTPPEQAPMTEARSSLWPKIIIVVLIIIACIEVGYIVYKRNSIANVEQAAKQQDPPSAVNP